LPNQRVWTIIIEIRCQEVKKMAVMQEKVVVIPMDIFETAESKEDLEDWLLGQNADFITKMREARRDDLRDSGKNWETVKKELCIK